MPRFQITITELTADGKSYGGRELYAQEFDDLDVKAIIATANGLPQPASFQLPSVNLPSVQWPDGSLRAAPPQPLSTGDAPPNPYSATCEETVDPGLLRGFHHIPHAPHAFDPSAAVRNQDGH